VERMKLLERIEIDPRECNGKPVIKGTRIPVNVILEQVNEGRYSGCPILRENIPRSF
jgi:uncharacterized protein (DUF433 family)